MVEMIVVIYRRYQTMYCVCNSGELKLFRNGNDF